MPLFTALGTLLGASAASAFTVGAGAVGVGAITGSSLYTASRSGKGGGFPDLPQTPTTEDALAKAKLSARQKRVAMSRSDTIMTSPLGISGQADVARKVLLGQ